MDSTILVGGPSLGVKLATIAFSSLKVVFLVTLFMRGELHPSISIPPMDAPRWSM